MQHLLSDAGFMPHGHCYLWDKGLLGLHVVSDALITASYFSIPITLLYFIRRRKDIKFSWMLVCFAAFIVACGGTHLMEIWTVWHPAYWISGSVKALTALASVPTAILLIRLLPEALVFPSATSMQEANHKLQCEMDARKRGEIALQRSQLMFQGLFDHAPNATILIDRSGLIVRANAQAGLLFGGGKELTNRNIEKLVPERLRLEFNGHLAACFAGPSPLTANFGFELFAWRNQGVEFPVDITLSCVEAEDGAKVIVVVRDITTRKTNEQEIQQLNAALNLRAKELELVNGEMEAFSYSVSHDLRAPLRHIGSFAHLLTDKLGPSSDATGLRYLGIISVAVTRMNKLIDDVLSFSSTSRASIRLTTVDIDRLVSEVVRFGSSTEGMTPIKWQIEALGTVEADASMLRQVWVNLIENAVKYSSKNPHPHIIICARTDLVAREQVFSVRDNGVGFDMAFAGKLFTPFQRLHASSEFEGTGIGLANIRRIVERHGGRTWAEGEVNQGATIYFSLPLTSIAPVSPTSSPFMGGTFSSDLAEGQSNPPERFGSKQNESNSPNETAASAHGGREVPHL